MAARSVSLVAVFNWVAEAFGLFARRFGTFVLAGLLTVGVYLLLCVPMFAVLGTTMMKLAHASQGGAMPAGAALMTVMGSLGLIIGMYLVTVLLMLVAMPPLIIGWMRLCQDADAGGAAGALDILQPYRDVALWTRGIGYMALAMLIGFAIFLVFALLFAAPLRGLMAASDGVPHFSGLLVLGYLLLMPTVMLFQFIVMVGFAQLGLADPSPVRALGAAAGASFRNLPQLVVLGIVLVIALFIGALGFGIVFAILGAVLSMVHPIAGVAIAYLVEIPVAVCMYGLMFAFQFYAWKGLLGDDTRLAGGGDAPVMA